jgi:hypothetical protein
MRKLLKEILMENQQIEKLATNNKTKPKNTKMKIL